MQAGETVPVADVAASFQEAVVDVLTAKAVRAARESGVDYLVIGGGVAANSRLRALAQERCDAVGLRLRVPPPRLCTDNGAMVAALGAQLAQANAAPSELTVAADPALPITDVLISVRWQHPGHERERWGGGRRDLLMWEVRAVGRAARGAAGPRPPSTPIRPPRYIGAARGSRGSWSSTPPVGAFRTSPTASPRAPRIPGPSSRCRETPHVESLALGGLECQLGLVDPRDGSRRPAST